MVPPIRAAALAIEEGSTMEPKIEPGHPAFFKVLDEIRSMHSRKSADYGSHGDALANFRTSTEFGIEDYVGCLIRANDKVRRIKSFIANGSLKNESFEDSLLDLASYSIIALCLFRESRQ